MFHPIGHLPNCSLALVLKVFRISYESSSSDAELPHLLKGVVVILKPPY